MEKSRRDESMRGEKSRKRMETTRDLQKKKKKE